MQTTNTTQATTEKIAGTISDIRARLDNLPRYEPPALSTTASRLRARGRQLFEKHPVATTAAVVAIAAVIVALAVAYLRRRR